MIACVIPKLGVFSSRARDLARVTLNPVAIHARFLVPLVRARDFGMTQPRREGGSVLPMSRKPRDPSTSLRASSGAAGSVAELERNLIREGVVAGARVRKMRKDGARCGCGGSTAEECVSENLPGMMSVIAMFRQLRLKPL